MNKALTIPNSCCRIQPSIVTPSEAPAEAHPTTHEPRGITGMKIRIPKTGQGSVDLRHLHSRPGDRLQVELLDLPELSGTFTGPDGPLPATSAIGLRRGLTVEELDIYSPRNSAIVDPGVCPTNYVSTDPHLWVEK